MFVKRTTVLSTLVRFNRLLGPLIKRTSVLGIISLSSQVSADCTMDSFLAQIGKPWVALTIPAGRDVIPDGPLSPAGAIHPALMQCPA